MAKRTFVYVGTYTCPIEFGTGHVLEGKGEGIYLLELDQATGELVKIQTTGDVMNPSYLVLNENQDFLYAVNEMKEFEGKSSGSVSSFAVDKKDGNLTYINKQATGGIDPCHVEVSPDGASLYASNFSSGSVCGYPVNMDGSIADSSQFIQHIGSSIDPEMQSGPHAHSLVFSPDGRYAFVSDLGLDKLMIYKVNKVTHSLEVDTPAFFATKPRAGPRYCTFDPSGRFCYIINELDSTILVLSYCAENGSFSELQKVSSLPEGINYPGNASADVHITPDGSYLFGSNRGHNSLIIYSIDKDTGLLSYAGCQPCGGETPRNFTIDPTGQYLLCANQDSDNIVVFEIDYNTGALTKKSEVNIPTPVCVKAYLFK